MKFERTEVWGFAHALRGMRNPKESWKKSDSVFRVLPDKNDVLLISCEKIVHHFYQEIL